MQSERESIIRLSNSKSKYLAAFQCHKRLWLEIHDRDKATPIDKGQEAIFNQGHYVGEVAQTYFPDGYLINSDYLDIPLGIKNTISVINDNPPSLYEGFFQFNDVLVRPDILKNNNDDGHIDLFIFLAVETMPILSPIFNFSGIIIITN